MFRRPIRDYRSSSQVPPHFCDVEVEDGKAILVWRDKKKPYSAAPVIRGCFYAKKKGDPYGGKGKNEGTDGKEHYGGNGYDP